MNRKYLTFIEGWRGSIGDPEKVKEEILQIHSNTPIRMTEDPTDVRWQDCVLKHEDCGPNIKGVVEGILLRAQTVIDEKLRVQEAPWFILNKPGEQIWPHTHGNKAQFAVVYWVQVPEKSGDLELFPAGIKNGDDPRVVEKAVAGEYLVFPAGLLHGVRQNQSQDYRIGVSFNLELERL